MGDATADAAATPDSRRTSRQSESPRSPHKSPYGLLITSSSSPSGAVDAGSSASERELAFGDLLDAVGGAADGVASARVLRLSWLGLTRVGDGLLGVGASLRDLYLQHNDLRRIEGLEALASLEFLALGSNKIRVLEGLAHLTQLRVLDVSENLIERLPEEEAGESGASAGASIGPVASTSSGAVAVLPTSLRVANFFGNPCSGLPGYRARLLTLMPSCMCLDREDVPGRSANKGEGPFGGEDEDGDLDDGSGGDGADGKAESPGHRAPAVASLALSASDPAPASASASTAAARPAPGFGAGALAVSAEDTALAVADLQQRYASRRAEQGARFASRLEAESARSAALAADLKAQGGAELARARDALRDFRESAVARSQERAAEQARRAAATTAAFEAAAAVDAGAAAGAGASASAPAGLQA